MSRGASGFDCAQKGEKLRFYGKKEKMSKNLKKEIDNTTSI